MNMLKKGPELKMPQLKVPDFLLDLYYDLKERRLLPLVAILLVALVALPIVLSSSSGAEEVEEAAAVATVSTATPTSSLVVTEAAPGLREYQRRLAGHSATDPFVQKFAEAEGSEGSASDGASGEAEVGGEAAGTTTGPGDDSGGAGSPIPAPGGEGGSGGDEPPEGGHLQYYSFAIDVRITPVSSKKKEKSTTRHNQPGMTMLPSRKVPALTFVGVSKDKKNAVMLVSDKVTGLFGDATCLEGSERCQLIALEPGIPETVVYGANARTYRITLLKMQLLKTDKLNTAPLGNSKKKKSDKGKEQDLAQVQVDQLVAGK
jgi:hypothetical protein